MPKKTAGKPSRSVARLNAVQALFQLEQGDGTASSITIEFLKYRLGHEVEGDIYRQADSTLFSTLLNGAAKEQDKIDEIIKGYLDKKWPLDRIESVVRAILRSAVYELLHAKDTPTPVIINEYLDITRAFYDDKEVGFVNGILDRIAKDIRSGKEESTDDGQVSV